MTVVQTPLVSARAVASASVFGEPSPTRLHTLQRRRAMSLGLPVQLRGEEGRFSGGVRVYSALAKDAARLFRLGNVDGAQRMARHSRSVETSDDAFHVRDAMRTAALRDVQQVERPRADSIDELRRSSMEAMRRGVGAPTLTRPIPDWDWALHPWNWFSVNDDAGLRDAVARLAQRIQEVRMEERSLEGSLHPESTKGVIERMDASVAEVRAEDGLILAAPRRDLARQGLARLGQAITITREELPEGFLLSYEAAVLLERPTVERLDPWDTQEAASFDDADSRWIRRLLAGRPAALPVAPLSVGSRE